MLSCESWCRRKRHGEARDPFTCRYHKQKTQMHPLIAQVYIDRCEQTGPYLKTTPLHCAVRTLDVNMASQTLANPGTIPNKQDANVHTPLHYAVEFAIKSGSKRPRKMLDALLKV